MRLSAEQLQFLDAAARGDVPAVRALLAAGVDVNSPDARQLPRDRTALMHAAERGHIEVVEVLLAAGAKVDAKDRGLGIALPGGNTALLLALKNKHTRVAQRLLEAGANPDVTSGGMSVFSQAAGLGDVPLVRQLLKMGLDPNQAAGKRADPPLASALFARHSEIVRVLVSAGADPNRPCRGGITPLEIAVEGGLAEAAQLLLHRGADPNMRSSAGFTPLMGAALRGQKEIVQILLERDAAVNARTQRGQTALDLVQQKLERNPGDDRSPLSGAPGLDSHGDLKLHQDIVSLLLKAGAKRGGELPPELRARTKAAPTKPRKPGNRRQQPEPARSGVKDFLQFAHYTEPEFAVIAVKAPIEMAAGAFAALRSGRRWIRDVPRVAAAQSGRANPSAIAAVKVGRNPWTVIYRSLFRLRRGDAGLAVEDARELSARLKTRAMVLVREKATEATGYDLFEKGGLLEQARWIDGGAFTSFKSRFRRQPKLDEVGEDFTDQVFRRQGIYLPACHPRIKRQCTCLCVEKASAKAIQRADVLVLSSARKQEPKAALRHGKRR